VTNILAVLMQPYRNSKGPVMGNTRLFTLEIMWSDWKVRGQAVDGVKEFTFTTLCFCLRNSISPGIWRHFMLIFCFAGYKTTGNLKLELQFSENSHHALHTLKLVDFVLMSSKSMALGKDTLVHTTDHFHPPLWAGD